MNADIIAKQKRGIAIALKQFPWLRDRGSCSGIYLWSRYDENGVYCWYIGKAKNLLHRTAQHIVDGQSHLDKSIKKHGFCGGKEGRRGWDLDIIKYCREDELDKLEQFWIDEWQKKYPNSKMYNIESGGTTGKTIIGEKKQRRDVKWKAEAKNKVLAKYREYFDLQPKENAYKNGGTELKAEPKQLKNEFYEIKNS